MIFVNVNAGHYLIIKNDIVVAEIKRRYKKTYKSKWPTAIYILIWKDCQEVESFSRVSDIHCKYPFENYKGFSHLLDPNRIYCDV